MKTLLQNGTLVRGDGCRRADLLIEDGKIAAIGENLPTDGAKIVDATDCCVFAGFIDTHTHFDLDLGVTITADNFITGSRAAVVGGTTCVLDFATQDRGMTMQDALDLWHKKAQGSSCHYGFHLAVSEWNEARCAEIPRMIEQGVTSFKMYMVYDTMRVDDGRIYDALQAAAKEDCLIGVHCENYDVLQARIRELKAAGHLAPKYHPISRPNAVEAEGVARLMRIAELAKAPAWVVHLSTAEGLEEAKRARARGQEVYLETCPQYFTLTDAAYDAPDGEKFIMSPPLRKEADVLAIRKAMTAGDIDFTGTDHCSFTMAQKALGGGDFSRVPNGGAGVQNRAALLYTYGVLGGFISLEQMARLLSENAAHIFGLAPEKGVLAVGADADVVVFDPNVSYTISYRSNLHNCDNSPYEGMAVRGACRSVFLDGIEVVKNGKCTAEGKGRFVHRHRSERPRK